MRKTIIVISYLIFAAVIKLYPQEIHFSQNALTGFSLNPAKTGAYEYNSRFYALTKIQWSSVSVPYKTYVAAFDGTVLRLPGRRDQLSMGISATREMAGDAAFGTTSVNLSAAWLTALNRRNKSFLSIGLNWGVNQRSFNFEALTFDNQFNGSYFDPSLPVGEYMPQEALWFHSVSLGGLYIYRPSTSGEISIGCSASSINRPRLDYFETSSIRMVPVYRTYFQYRFNTSRDLEFNPELYLAFQKPFREIFPMFYMRRIFDYRSYSFLATGAGIGYRVGDAIVLRFGVDYLKWRFGISYDVNLSQLVPASHFRGGFEWAVVRYFDHPEIRKKKEIPCPIF